MAGVRKIFSYLPPTERSKYRGLSEEEAKTLSEGTAAWSRKLLRDPEFLFKAITSSPNFDRAYVITARLLSSDRELLLHRQCKDRLNAVEIGLCFVALADSDPHDLAWLLNRWFKWFGIDRAAKVGRPQGRDAERKHYECFKEFEQRLAKDRVWSRKQKLRRQFRRDWKARLHQELLEMGWETEDIEYVIRSKSPRSCALYLAAKHLEVSYEVIRRSVQCVCAPLAIPILRILRRSPLDVGTKISR